MISISLAALLALFFFFSFACSSIEGHILDFTLVSCLLAETVAFCMVSSNHLLPKILSQVAPVSGTLAF